MPTRRYSASVSIGDRTLSGEKTVTESGALTISEDIPADATDYEINLPLGDSGNIKGLFIVASKNMTLEFNSGSAPEATITLAAEVPFVWYNTAGWNLTFGDQILDGLDIQTLFVTNGAVGGRLELDALFDVTP